MTCILYDVMSVVHPLPLFSAAAAAGAIENRKYYRQFLHGPFTPR